MPSSVSILCQIKSKKLDGGFINGLAIYMDSQEMSKDFYYGFYKKQISPFLHDLEIGDHVLICGKCVFNKENMHVNINYIFYHPNIIIKILIITLKI